MRAFSSRQRIIYEANKELEENTLNDLNKKTSLMEKSENKKISFLNNQNVIIENNIQKDKNIEHENSNVDELNKSFEVEDVNEFNKKYNKIEGSMITTNNIDIKIENNIATSSQARDFLYSHGTSAKSTARFEEDNSIDEKIGKRLSMIKTINND